MNTLPDMNALEHADVIDLQKAMHALMNSQFLFAQRPNDRKHINVINQHISYARELMNALGYDFHSVSSNMIAIIPDRDILKAGSGNRIRGMDARVMLMLLNVYTTKKHGGEIDEYGSVETNYTEILEQLKNFVQDIDTQKFNRAIRFCEKQNILKSMGSTVDEITESKTFWIRILPSIELVVSKELMDSFLESGGEEPEDDVDDTGDEAYPEQEQIAENTI